MTHHTNRRERDTRQRSPRAAHPPAPGTDPHEGNPNVHATPEPYARRWQALGVLVASLLVITIDNTILNVALPSLRADLDVDSSQAQWVVDSYLLVFAGLLLVGGTLGDRFGRRKFLMLGLLVFGAARVWRRCRGAPTSSSPRGP